MHLKPVRLRAAAGSPQLIRPLLTALGRFDSWQLTEFVLLRHKAGVWTAMNRWPKNVCFISRATTETSECRQAETLCCVSLLHRGFPLPHIEPMTSHVDQYSNKKGFLAQLKGGLKQTQNEFRIERMPRAASLTHKTEHLLYGRWRLHISGPLVIKSQAVMAWHSFHVCQSRYYMEYMFKYAKANSALRKKITWTILVADKKKWQSDKWQYQVCWKKHTFHL